MFLAVFNFDMLAMAAIFLGSGSFPSLDTM